MRRMESENHRALWEKKRVLRAVYEDYYDEIIRRCHAGPILEIGAGVGNLKERVGDLLSVDIVHSDWTDVVADAQALPFATCSFANVIAVDVLHHVAKPLSMLRECTRVLENNGSLIILEPAVTPVSWSFYKFLHPERLDLSVDPLKDAPLSDPRDPDDANQALATLLVTRYAERLEHACRGLEIVERRWLSLLVYPLSGGFRPWSMIPAIAAPALLRIDRCLSPLLGRWFGFRLLIVLRKVV